MTFPRRYSCSLGYLECPTLVRLARGKCVTSRRGASVATDSSGLGAAAEGYMCIQTFAADVAANRA